MKSKARRSLGRKFVSAITQRKPAIEGLCALAMECHPHASPSEALQALLLDIAEVVGHGKGPSKGGHPKPAAPQGSSGLSLGPARWKTSKGEVPVRIVGFKDGLAHIVTGRGFEIYLAARSLVQ